MATFKFLSQAKSGVRLSLWVKPGARKCEAGGVYDGKLKMAVKEPAQDGRANDAVEEFVAKLLQVPRKRVRLEKGTTSRAKIIYISDLTCAEAAQRLEKLGVDIIS